MKREFIKFVNYGKNGIYLYSAIVKIDNVYYFTESVMCKNVSDKHNIDIDKLKISKPLNEYAMNQHINISK